MFSICTSTSVSLETKLSRTKTALNKTIYCLEVLTEEFVRVTKLRTMAIVSEPLESG